MCQKGDSLEPGTCFERRGLELLVAAYQGLVHHVVGLAWPSTALSYFVVAVVEPGLIDRDELPHLLDRLDAALPYTGQHSVVMPAFSFGDFASERFVEQYSLEPS